MASIIKDGEPNYLISNPVFKLEKKDQKNCKLSDALDIQFSNKMMRIKDIVMELHNIKSNYIDINKY